MPLSDGILSGDVVTLAILIRADFADSPVLAAMSPMPISVPADLPEAGVAAGLTFDVANTDVLQVSPVSSGAGGFDSFTATFFADPDNPQLIDAVNDPTLYSGRDIALWMVTANAAGVANGIEPIFAGTMAQPSESISADGWTLSMVCESYLALLSGAQNRTYLSQKIYDAGDESAAATLAVGSNSPGVSGVGRGLAAALFGRIQER
ncbi:MAG: hypothetical protein MUE77_10265 [Sandarakinorhabdus sp.]|jgi:hypothetical protein|nr:hypothetical protein [Sandarakinorhabdus sp.]